MLPMNFCCCSSYYYWVFGGGGIIEAHGPPVNMCASYSQRWSWPLTYGALCRNNSARGKQNAEESTWSLTILIGLELLDRDNHRTERGHWT